MTLLVCIEVPSSVVYLASLGDAVTPLRSESSVAVDLRSLTTRRGEKLCRVKFPQVSCECCIHSPDRRSPNIR